MKILLCPDKFKGSLSSEKVCLALEKGLKQQNKNFEIIKHPMADGGDGSIAILKKQLHLKQIKVATLDPLNRNIIAEYYYKDHTAYIELASASGLSLLHDQEKSPMISSTKGTGLMIKDAIEKGFQTIYLFIGGSATNDAGMGIAHALGFVFIDENGNPLDPVGKNLIKISKIKNNSAIDFQKLNIVVLCDVNNPMHGPNGAAHRFAAQKGASDEEILKLDEGLKHFETIVKSQFNKNLAHIPGIGAAGAVGASLVSLLQAQLQNGFQMIANITGLKEAIKSVDLVITGEGKLDQSSFQGKLVGKVHELSKELGKNCGVVAGMIDTTQENNSKFIFQKSIDDLANDLEDAMKSAEKYLLEIAQTLEIPK